ncbi:MAG TPA: glycosyltransferase family 87 protein [Pirellulales bacterium]
MLLRSAIIGWFAFAVALCLKVWIQGADHSVYGAFVIGPRHWWAGAAMYNDRSYFYSPTFSVLFTPFALLPDWLGQTLWGLVSVGLFFWSLRAFYRHVMPNNWPRQAEGAFLWLVLAGALRGIWSLQSNAILMAGVLFAAAAIVRYRWWRAAWFLAAPVYIKVWPLIAAGLLGIQWPRKLIGRVALAIVAFGFIPLLTKSPIDVTVYYRAWIERLTQRQENVERFTGYRDAWTIWEQIRAPVDPHGYLLLQAAGGMAVLAWCVWLKRSRNTSRSAAEIATYTLAIWACWQLLFGPGTERLTYMIVAPFAAWVVITSYFERKNFSLAIAAIVTTFILGSGKIERVLAPAIPAAVALQPFGVILFVVWLVRHANIGRPWEARLQKSAPAQLVEPQTACSAAV